MNSFYASSTPELIEVALGWANMYTGMTLEQRKIVFQASKSFLYSRGDAWVKKGNTNFDMGIGGSNQFYKERMGNEKMWQTIIKVFKDHNLDIRIDVGLSSVNFNDVTLDLEKEQFKTYRKQGNKPMYVNFLRNHPTRVLMNIPVGINR